MIEILKKLGLPAGVAAVVGALVAVIPFVFKIDERYAKAEELNSKLVVVSKQINDLTVEVGKLAGMQQVIVAVMSAKPSDVAQPVKIVEAAKPAPFGLVLDATPPAFEPPIPLTPPKSSVEKKERLEAVSRALANTQRQVENIQSYKH
jgi:hypothetical protein